MTSANDAGLLRPDECVTLERDNDFVYIRYRLHDRRMARWYPAEEWARDAVRTLPRVLDECRSALNVGQCSF